MSRTQKLSPPALFRAVEDAFAEFEVLSTAHEAVRQPPGYMYDERTLPVGKDRAIATLEFLYHIATSKDRSLTKHLKRLYPNEYKELRSAWFRKRLLSYAMLLAHYRPPEEAELCNKHDGGHAILIVGVILNATNEERARYFGLRLRIDQEAEGFASRLKASDLIVETE